MQNENRAMFISAMNENRSRQQQDPNTNANERLRQISMTKVHDTTEFDRLFQEAVERQQRAKEAERGKSDNAGSVIKDDAFADIDKEFGF